MASIKILEKIESLPPLPKTILEVEEYRKNPSKDVDELLEIIKKDALVISTLLKISNSAMFGFRSKVETPDRAVNLLGINFTISVIIGGTIRNLLVANLSPYDIDNDAFMKSSNYSSSLATNWLAKVDLELKDKIMLPALLQEAGKFVLSEVLISEKKSDEFKEKLISSNYQTSKIEKEILNSTTSEVTSKIFKHWKLSSDLIDIIEFVDDVNNQNNKYPKEAKMLDVIKTACDAKNLLGDEQVNHAIKKAEAYNLDTKHLKSAIEKLQDRLLDEE